MLNFALLLLALAAGIYLLIKANSLFLGKIYAALIWLEIGLSLAGIGGMAYKGIAHQRHPGCGDKKECRVEKQVIIKDGVETTHTSSSCSAHGCKIEGDSVVLDKAVCEKVIGKEACDAMNKERGRCILSKEECSKACAAAGVPCCAQKEEASCSHKCEGQKKECCKQKH